jgi:hypothetical protein
MGADLFEGQGKNKQLKHRQNRCFKVGRPKMAAGNFHKAAHRNFRGVLQTDAEESFFMQDMTAAANETHAKNDKKEL